MDVAHFRIDRDIIKKIKYKKISEKCVYEREREREEEKKRNIEVKGKMTIQLIYVLLSFMYI